MAGLGTWIQGWIGLRAGSQISEAEGLGWVEGLNISQRAGLKP